MINQFTLKKSALCASILLLPMLMVWGLSQTLSAQAQVSERNLNQPPNTAVDAPLGTTNSHNFTETAVLTASLNSFDAFGSYMAVDGDTAFISADLEDGSISNEGAVYVFTRSGTPPTWQRTQRLVASNASPGARFGIGVDIDGDTAVVGAWQATINGRPSGAAYVFTRINGEWVETQTLSPDEAYIPASGLTIFGKNVALDGDTLIVGASRAFSPESNSPTGVVFAYQRSATTGLWEEQQVLVGSDPFIHPNPLNSFGDAVALDGNTALIGENKALSTGQAYVFNRSETTGLWSETQILTGSEVIPDDQFGLAVAVDGDTAVVGTYLNAAYVFQRSEATGIWSETQKLTSSEPEPDWFGVTLDLVDNGLIVGAALTNVDGMFNQGMVHYFTRPDEASPWQEQQKLTTSDSTEPGIFGSDFGSSVGLLGDTLFVGANGVNENRGAVYIFERPPTIYTLTTTITGTGMGTVTSQPEGVACGGECVAPFTAGTLVTLTAVAETGSTFTGWSGDVVTTTNPLTVIMDANKAITATFALNEYILTTDTAGEGSGQVQSDPAGTTFTHGSMVTLTAVAETGSTFTGWSGDVVTSTNPLTVMMDADKTITATFALDEHTLTVDTAGEGSGQVQSDPTGPTFTHGSMVTLTAVAETGSTFTGWSGDVITSTNPLMLTMDSSKTITATFALDETGFAIYLPLILR